MKSGDQHGFERQYRRGAIMGMTMAEAFVLIAFALLLLFSFWRWEVDRENTEHVVAFKNLPGKSQKAFLEAVNDGSLQVFVSLKKAGVDFSAPEVAKDIPERWRFIDKDDLVRLQDAAAQLPEDVQRDLADLVEVGDAEAILSQMAVLEQLADMQLPPDLLRAYINQIANQQNEASSISEIAKKIRNAENQEIALVRTLRSELGQLVSEIGGEIHDDGSIVLPDAVLFRQGSATIEPVLADFLADACGPWLSVLKASGVDILEVKIEGHASSEWRAGASPREAYLGNLDLSQRRSQAVLRTCLDLVPDEDTLGWARERMIAAGYSSGRPVLENGQENREASRRVVFSVTSNRETLLDEIGETVDQPSYDRTQFGRWMDEDGDGLNTRAELLLATSKAPVTFNSSRSAVRSGEWVDRYTGKTFTSAFEVQVDHLVPLSWAWERGASEWDDDKRKRFANDLSNLVIVEGAVNLEKGASGPDQWLPPLIEVRCDYIKSFEAVVASYGLELSQDEGEIYGELRQSYCTE